MMCCDVVDDQFRANVNHRTIRYEQICVAAGRIVLAEFTMVDTTERHRLPWIGEQGLQLLEYLRISRADCEVFVSTEPSHGAQDVRVFLTEIVTIRQIFKVGHGAFSAG